MDSFPHDVEVVRQAALARASLIDGDRAAGHMRLVQASFAAVITDFVRDRYRQVPDVDLVAEVAGATVAAALIVALEKWGRDKCEATCPRCPPKASRCSGRASRRSTEGLAAVQDSRAVARRAPHPRHPVGVLVGDQVAHHPHRQTHQPPRAHRHRPGQRQEARQRQQQPSRRATENPRA
jgi:hypothetical protein